MSNPSNLIRPPVIQMPPLGEPIINDNRLPLNMEETIARICAQQCQVAIRQLMRPSSDIAGVDQIIEERFRNNLDDLDKVPGVIKSLKDFSGIATEFSAWKKGVDRILKLYDSIKGTPKYFAILNTIRNKVVGNADAALESYNTPLNWESISKCLTLHYADKRDLTTLEYQMTTLVQGNSRVQDFYQEVYSHLSLIMNKLSCMDIGRESLDILSQTYRDKALDVFIRGLKGQMSIHLGMKEPTDLPQALQLCLKMENQFARAQFANSHNHTSRNNRQNFQSHPPLPPKPQYQKQNLTPFYPQLAHLPQPSANMQHYGMTMPMYQQRTIPPSYQNPNQRYQPPRPAAPKPQPRPEPMEVDLSMQTRAINYMNRPAQDKRYFGKRPTDQSDQLRKPDKIQRNFHLDTNDAQLQTPQDYESTIDNYEDEEKLPPLNDYIQDQYDALGDDNQLETQDFVDINFLD